MSDGEGAVLGRVVFGTARGLFAIGTGALAGAAESADAFELRAADPRRSLVPAMDRPILLRRALRLSTGGHVDLIAVANGVSDLERRPGFLGYGIAVEYSDLDGYQDAMGLLWEEFRPAFEHYTEANRFRDGVPPFVVPKVKGWSGALPSLADAGRKTPPILLTLPDWWMHARFVTDFLDTTARWSGREAATVLVGADDRPGAFAATPELFERMNEETELRAEEERKRADEAELERAGVSLGQDHLARRRIQRLEDQVRGLEREIKGLKRQLFMISAPGIATEGPKERTMGGIQSLLENRWVLSGMAAAGVGIIILIATLFLLGREEEVAKTELPNKTSISVPARSTVNGGASPPSAPIVPLNPATPESSSAVADHPLPKP